MRKINEEMDKGKIFRRRVGQRVIVATKHWHNETRLFKRDGLVVMVDFENLYLDKGGTLRKIPLDEIIEIREVNFEGR